MTIKLLNCYCEHCLNNTCTTNQLCYAEWKLKPPADATGSSTLAATSAFSPLLSTSNLTPTTSSSSSLSSSSSSSLSSPSLTSLVNKNFDLIQDYNCFEKDEPVFIASICSETVTTTSHVIRRCCKSGDYCNKDSNLLPNKSEAIKIFRRHMPENYGDNIFAHIYEQYSNLPLGIQIILLILTTIIILYAIILVRNAANRRRRRQRHLRNDLYNHRRSQSGCNINNSGNIKSGNVFKRVLNRILLYLGLKASRYQANNGDYFQHSHPSSGGTGYNQRIATQTSGCRIDVPAVLRDTGAAPHRFGVSSGAATTSISGAPSGVVPSSRHDEDFSEYSSIKAPSDFTVFDTNSMASREPLISARNRLNSNVDPLVHQHASPYMGEEAKNHSSFQMTLGSAAEELCRQDTSSGSGAGQPYLTQRSIANDIQLVEVVGQGFFGVVWRGEHKGEPVAVKIFSSTAEPSWEREAEIYQTTMLRHKNILGFIATDKRQDAAHTGYWLVTDFYPMGSLYDFLKENTLSMSDAIRMAFSIANGLTHLHVEIQGTRGKPAIAHRDLKSKNILVKNDGTCCIADLGMAVRFNSHSAIVDVPTNTRIGTRRYLAPEILENTLNLMDFELVKATDIYALGLVLWEILRRTCLMHPPSDPNFSFNIEQQTTAPTTPSRSGTPPASQGQAMNSSPLVVSSPESKVHHDERQNLDQADREGTGSHQLPESKIQRTSTPPSLYQLPQSSISKRPDSQPHAPQQQYTPQQRTFANESIATTVDDPNTDLAFLVEPYEAPYQQYVPMDPSADDMREVVCVRKIRPALSPRWAKFASMRDYANLMTECWYDKPQARLTALRLRKSLGDVAKKYFNINMEYD